MDDNSDFVLTGNLGEHPPADPSVVIYGESPLLGALALSQMQVAADGTFRITVDPRPADGRPNQVAANADGTVTFVISPKDPGVQNWLDTSGLTLGLMALRWQGVPAGQTSEQAVRSVQVVPYKDLHQVLPAGTRYVSAKQRKAQLAERFDDCHRRMG